MRDPSHNWAYPAARLEAYFADAHLKVEHTESFSKEVEFEPWADRTSASEETKAALRRLLLQAPAAAREWLAPRVDGDMLYFSLTEAIVVGRKDK